MFSIKDKLMNDVVKFREKNKVSRSKMSLDVTEGRDGRLITRVENKDNVTSGYIDKIYKYMETYKSSNKG